MYFRCSLTGTKYSSYGSSISTCVSFFTGSPCLPFVCLFKLTSSKLTASKLEWWNQILFSVRIQVGSKVRAEAPHAIDSVHQLYWPNGLSAGFPLVDSFKLISVMPFCPNELNGRAPDLSFSKAGLSSPFVGCLLAISLRVNTSCSSLLVDAASDVVFDLVDRGDGVGVMTAIFVLLSSPMETWISCL